jgi:uncharacterized small protein (DUF1192 family)
LEVTVIMANFDELKEKAKATIGAIADVSVELYKVAGEKAKVLARITKLSAEIARERGGVRRLYGEIGSKYYKSHKDAPERELEQPVAEVTAALERIADKQKEIDILKSAGNISDAEYEAAERDAGDGEAGSSESEGDGE